MIESNTGNTIIDNSVDEISSFANRVHNKINQLESKSEYEISCVPDSDNSSMLVIQKM